MIHDQPITIRRPRENKITIGKAMRAKTKKNDSWSNYTCHAKPTPKPTQIPTILNIVTKIDNPAAVNLYLLEM